MRVGEKLVDCVAVLGATTVRGVLVTPQQRALVAAIALYGDRGASIDQLVDAVWGHEAPGSARASLQNQMTRLRRAHGDNILICDQGRYRLGLATDVASFERLLAGPASPQSLALALDLWRGTPFHDLSECNEAEVERSRLDQMRADAVERLASTKILSGDFPGAIALATEQVEINSYRDRGWELLLVALHLSGRTAEALCTYGRYVAMLETELGGVPAQNMTLLAAAMKRGEPVRLDGEVVAAKRLSATMRRECGYHRRSRCRVVRSR